MYPVSMRDLPPHRRRGRRWSRLPLAVPIWTVLSCALWALISCLSYAVGIWETLGSIIFEVLSLFTGRHSSGIYGREESAVAILHAEDGIGRKAVMTFSELGYTVFALCPTTAERRSGSLTPDSSNVTSLLQEWHNKKERAHGRRRWGLIAPITFDQGSKTDRTRAYETVQAYCANHSLNLVALLLSPPPDLPDLGTQGSIPMATASEEVWMRMLSRHIMEPVLVAQDYVRLLRHTAGRVIFIATCSERDILSGVGPRHSIIAARQALLRTLSDELEDVRIRVALVHAGPMARPPDAPKKASKLSRLHSPPSDDASIFVSHTISRDSRVVSAIRRCMRPFFITDEDVLSVVRLIVELRYPKYTYSVGVLPTIQSFVGAIPENMQTILRWCLHEHAT